MGDGRGVVHGKLVLPIPPDALLIPMVLARPDRGWTIAFVCTTASVLGGMFGYAIGYFLYETLGKWLIDLYGMAQGYESSSSPTPSGASGSS